MSATAAINVLLFVQLQIVGRFWLKIRKVLSLESSKMGFFYVGDERFFSTAKHRYAHDAWIHSWIRYAAGDYAISTSLVLVEWSSV